MKPDKAKALTATPVAATPKAVQSAGVATRHSRAYAVLVKPLVSEKGAHGSIYDTYAFVVNRYTNKVEIAKAFRATYNLKPLAVRTLLMPEKRKRAGKRMGTRAIWKKALIRVPKGSKKVDVFAGV